MVSPLRRDAVSPLTAPPSERCTGVFVVAPSASGAVCSQCSLDGLSPGGLSSALSRHRRRGGDHGNLRRASVFRRRRRCASQTLLRSVVCEGLSQRCKDWCQRYVPMRRQQHKRRRGERLPRHRVPGAVSAPRPWDCGGGGLAPPAAARGGGGRSWPEPPPRLLFRARRRIPRHALTTTTR